MDIKQLHKQIAAEFEEAKADYHAAKRDGRLQRHELAELEGSLNAWSHAFELSYKAVNS
jgi:hypothetical protein